MIKSGQFLYWSRNGIGPNALLKTLADHYIKLSAAYLQKGMKEEAELFANVTEEIEKIKQEIKILMNE